MNIILLSLKLVKKEKGSQKIEVEITVQTKLQLRTIEFSAPNIENENGQKTH